MRYWLQAKKGIDKGKGEALGTAAPEARVQLLRNAVNSTTIIPALLQVMLYCHFCCAQAPDLDMSVVANLHHLLNVIIYYIEPDFANLS